MKILGIPMCVLIGIMILGTATYAFDDSKIINHSRLQKRSSMVRTFKIADIRNLFNEALFCCNASQNIWQKGNAQKAIEILDLAYAFILKIDTHLFPELLQQKKELRLMITKRILEIYTSETMRATSSHKEIPVIMNQYVRTELEALKRCGGKKFFKNAYKRSGTYRPHITTLLKNAGLPEELSWLPLIESGFIPDALSSARALGLWQFIPSTGYKYGLKRDVYIDERLDPLKATHAAINYLKELHRIFGDWATVLAAYNCGEETVLKIIRRQNLKYLDNFWDLYTRLPKETARYVPRFMATLHMINHPNVYNLDSIEVDEPIAFDTINLSKQIHLKDIASAIGSTEALLVTLNPELRYRILPPRDYNLRVPKGKIDRLVASITDIPLVPLPGMAFSFHTVRPGETLSYIAMQYKTSPDYLAHLNNITNQEFIVVGEIIKIPVIEPLLSKSKKTFPISTVNA